MSNLFDLTGKTALITGAAGLLGPKHAEAILEQNGNVILSDRDVERATMVAEQLNEKYNCMRALPMYMDVTDKESIDAVVNSHQRIDILINNAAKDPKVKSRLKKAYDYAKKRKEASKKKTQAMKKGSK